MDVNKKRNVVALLTLLFLAFFLPFSLSIIINEEKVTSQQSVAKLPPFSFSDEFALTGQGNEVAIARTGDDVKSVPPTLVAAQEALENKYPASFLSARNANTTSKKLVAAESVTDTSTESLGEIFEGWSATGPLDAYTKYSISSFTREKDGTGSQMITAEQKGVGISRHFTGLDPTKTYQAEAWVYTEKGGAQVGINDQITPTKVTAEWVNLISQPFTKVSDINLYLTTNEDNSVFFVDGVTVSEAGMKGGEGPTTVISRMLSGPHFTACGGVRIDSLHPPVDSYEILIQESDGYGWRLKSDIKQTWTYVGSFPDAGWEMTADFRSDKTYKAFFILNGRDSNNEEYTIETREYSSLTFQDFNDGTNACFDAWCTPILDIQYGFSYCNQPTPTSTPTPHVITFSGQFKCNGININDPSNSARLSGEMHIENYDQQRHYYQATGSNSFTGPFTLDYLKINLQPKSLYFVLKKDGQVLDQSGVSTNWGILETAQPWIGFSMPNGPICTGPGCNPQINNIVIDFPYCDNVCTPFSPPEAGGKAPDTVVIQSFTASPSTVSPGTFSDLSWDVSGANTCILTGGGINLSFTGSQCDQTHRVNNIQNTTTYTITCGVNGSGSANATTTVTVSSNPPTPTRTPTPRPGTPTQVPTNTPAQPTPTPIDCVRAYGSSGYCQSQADCVRNIQMNQRPWTFNSNNTYCAQTPGQPINGCCYCTDLAGNPIPLCDGACNPYDPQCQGGGPPPPEDPPGCDSSQVTMSANPNPVTATNNVTLNINGSQGSTFPRDVFSGGLTNCGSWQGTWPKSKVCRAETPNTYTWTHYWKNCDNEACQNPSPECSKSYTYTIQSNATATPTRTPTPACNKVAINNVTVGPMNQLPTSAIASQNHLSFTYQKISGSANPEKIVLSGIYNTSQNTGPINNFFNPTNNTYQYDVTNLWPNHSVNTVINKYKFDVVWPTGTNVCADSPSTVYSNVVTIPLYNPHGTARVQALNTTPTPYPASCRLFGWTRDQDADKRAVPAQGVPVSIHVYKNGTFNGGGQFLTSTTANIVRSDLPFGTGFQNHGYDINFYTALTPTALAELTGSTTIPLYVYAINSTGTAGGNTVISPLTTSGVSTLSIRCTPNGPTLTPTRTPTPTVNTCPPITNFSAGYTTCNPDHTAQAQFTWTPVTSATYSLQVSTDSNFTSPYTFPTFSVQPFLSNISSPANPRWYRMKVQSAPGCTVPGNWSPIVGPISRAGC